MTLKISRAQVVTPTTLLFLKKPGEEKKNKQPKKSDVTYLWPRYITRRFEMRSFFPPPVHADNTRSLAVWEDGRIRQLKG